VEVERKKSRAQEREFYRDYIYPKPKEKPTGYTGRSRGSRGGGVRRRGAAVVILLLLGLAGALLLFDFLSNGLAVGLFKKTSGSIALKAADYYAVETGAFTSLNQAKARADETVAAGGAGYIYNDGTFHVIYSAYAKQQDAAAALASVPAADIFTVKIAGKTVDYQGGRQQKQALQEAFLMPLTVFASMSDAAARLKSGTLTTAQCYLKLQTLETDAQTAVAKLAVAEGSGAAMPLLRIKAELTSIVNILSDTADLTADAVTLRRDLNYNAVKILCSFKDMIAEV
jgi:hypothetical protein